MDLLKNYQEKNIKKKYNKTIGGIGHYENCEYINLNQNINLDILKFEPSAYPRIVNHINYDEYISLQFLVNEFYERIAFNKKIIIDNVENMSLYKKYIYMLRFFQNKNYIIGKNHQVEIDNNYYKALLILLVSDPNCEYLTYYKELKDKGLDINEIKQEIIKNFHFYSYKLLDLELQYDNLIKSYEDTLDCKIR